MAKAKLEVQVVGDASSLQRALRQSSAAAGSFGSRMAKVGKVVAVGALGAIGAAAAGMAVTLKRGWDEIAEGQQVSAQTAAALKSTGGVANVTAKDISNLASRLSHLTGVDDEQIQANENLLLTFKNVRNEVGEGNKIFDRATQASLDLSRAGFGSLDSAAKMLGKALNDPIKGMTAMGRAGVTFSEDQKKAIKALVDTGHELDAQKLILKEVESQVGGSAKAYGETLPGQLDKARNAFDEIAGNVTAKFLPMLTSVLEWVNTHWPEIEAVINAGATAIIATFDAISTSVEFVRGQWEKHRDTAIKSWEAVRDAIERTVNWFKANVVPPIRQAVDTIRALWDRFGNDILAILNRTFPVVVNLVKTWIQNMLAPLRIFLDLLRGDFGAAWDEVKGVFSRTIGAITQLLSATVQNWLTAAKALGRAILDGFLDVLTGIGEKFRNRFIDPIMNTLENWAGAVGRAAGKIVLAIIEPFTHLPSFLGAPFRKAKDEINAALGTIEKDSGAKAYQSGFTIGQFMAAGLSAGIAAAAYQAVQAAQQAVAAVIAAANAAAGNRSPSRKMQEVGDLMMQGLGLGIMKGTGPVRRIVADSFQAIGRTVKPAATGVGVALKEGLDAPSKAVIKTWDEFGATKDELIVNLKLLQKTSEDSKDPINEGIVKPVSELRGFAKEARNMVGELRDQIKLLNGSKAQATIDILRTEYVRTIQVGGGGGDGGFVENPFIFPALAAGGVVKKPTLAWIAEAGRPEAVVPLPRGGLPVAGGGVGARPIVVNFNGPVAGERQMADMVRRELLRTLNRGGSTGIV